MSITLTSEQEEIINEKLQSGRYTSAAEVIDEGLRLLARREQEGKKLESLRAEIQKGIDQIERGEYLSFNSAEKIKAHFQRRVEQHLASQENGEKK